MASGKIEAQKALKLARGPERYLCAGTPPGGGLAGWPAAACSWTWHWPSWLRTLNGPTQSSGPLHPVAGPGTHRRVARSLAGPGVGRGAVSGVGTTLFGLEWFLTLCLSFPISQPTCWASLFSRVLQEVGECRMTEISSAAYRERCCACEADALHETAPLLLVRPATSPWSLAFPVCRSPDACLPACLLVHVLSSLCPQHPPSWSTRASSPWPDPDPHLWGPFPSLPASGLLPPRLQ